jgi:uncharacterized protein (PEP-CTERM system associated)
MNRVYPGLLAAALSATGAAAQSSFEVRPSVSLLQVYDDNLFATETEPKADFYWRLMPRVGATRRGSRLWLRAEYGLDVERFGTHSELSGVAGQQAALSVEWRASALVVVRATAAYVSARTSGELNTLTGLQVGRSTARVFSTKGSLSRRLGTRTEVTLDHDFTRQEVASTPDNDTHAVTLKLERQLGQINLGRVTGGVRRYSFDAEPVVAHVMMLGWTRELTSLLHFELDVGPNWSGHAVGGEVTASFSRRFRRGNAGVAYSRVRTTVVGEEGPVTAEGVTAIVNRQMGRLSVGARPSLFRVRGEDEDSTVRRWALEATWHLTRRLALFASHQLTLQNGGVGLLRGADAEIAHNTFLIGVAATPAGVEGGSHARYGP